MSEIQTDTSSWQKKWFWKQTSQPLKWYHRTLLPHGVQPNRFLSPFWISILRTSCKSKRFWKKKSYFLGWYQMIITRCMNTNIAIKNTNLSYISFINLYQQRIFWSAREEDRVKYNELINILNGILRHNIDLSQPCWESLIYTLP